MFVREREYFVGEGGGRVCSGNGRKGVWEKEREEGGSEGGGRCVGGGEGVWRGGWEEVGGGRGWRVFFLFWRRGGGERGVPHLNSETSFKHAGHVS